MHRERERALGHLPLRGNVHVDGQHFFQLAALPASRAEGVLPADHHDAAAHVVDVLREVLVLIFAEAARAARNVGEDDRVVVLQLDDRVGELIDRRALVIGLDAFALERIAQDPPATVADVVDVQDFALAFDERERGGLIVLEQRVGAGGDLRG